MQRHNLNLTDKNTLSFSHIFFFYSKFTCFIIKKRKEESVQGIPKKQKDYLCGVSVSTLHCYNYK